jgi:hypothetical protein
MRRVKWGSVRGRDCFSTDQPANRQQRFRQKTIATVALSLNPSVSPIGRGTPFCANRKPEKV